jgi:hypothetical protein
MTNRETIVQENSYNTEWMEQDGEMRASVINSRELAAGLLFLLKDYYIGSFDIDGNEIVVAFNNGQKFSIIVKQCA